jgi:hypothetical protein
MTEQLLDALRPKAATAHDETSRLFRELKGSGEKPTALEHAINAHKALTELLILLGWKWEPAQSLLASADQPVAATSRTIDLSTSALTKSAAEVLANPPVPPVLARNRKK